MIVLKAKRHKKLLVALIVVISLIGALFIAGAVYVSDYYHADDEAINAFMPMHDISVCELDDGITVFSPEGAKAGLIFYPGGKVEHSAYAPLMAACASEGVMCVLVQMPFNLAVLDINAADGIQEQFPEISEWYIGGHSLGGSMAASYAAKHQDEFCGLVLLAAYSTADLTESGLKVLSIYGSEDGVMNREKYEANKTNLPADHVEIVINGGNHAYFGMYGEQDGDGTAAVTNADQITATAKEIAKITE